MASEFSKLVDELARTIDQRVVAKSSGDIAEQLLRPGAIPSGMTNLAGVAGRPHRAQAPVPAPRVEAVIRDLQQHQRAARRASVDDTVASIPGLYARLGQMAAAGRLTAVQAAKLEAEIHRLGAFATAARARLS